MIHKSRLLVMLVAQGTFARHNPDEPAQRATIPVYGFETLIQSDTSACGRIEPRAEVTFIRRYDGTGAIADEFKVLGTFEDVRNAIKTAVTENREVEIASTAPRKSQEDAGLLPGSENGLVEVESVPATAVPAFPFTCCQVACWSCWSRRVRSRMKSSRSR